MNIDESRIGTEKIRVTHHKGACYSQSYKESGGKAQLSGYTEHQGRWPANVLLDEVAAELLDEQSGRFARQIGMKKTQGDFRYQPGKEEKGQAFKQGLKDFGGASRFFYVAKASKSERNRGLDGMPKKVTNPTAPLGKDSHPRDGANRAAAAANHHPTVKPIKLMEYLCRLITPLGGVVLDPFMGSGSTGIAALGLGFDFLGIERNREYFEIASKRIKALKMQG